MPKHSPPDVQAMYADAVGHDGATLQEVAQELGVAVGYALHDLRTMVSLGILVYDAGPGLYRRAVDRRTCPHIWRVRPGTGGLIDGCERCGEARA